MNEFEVDYNDRDTDGLLKASMRFASRPDQTPERGETVWTADDEDHICRGIVARVQGPVVYIELDRSTWRVLGPAERALIAVGGLTIEGAERQPVAA